MSYSVKSRPWIELINMVPSISTDLPSYSELLVEMFSYPSVSSIPVTFGTLGTEIPVPTITTLKKNKVRRKVLGQKSYG